jgi:glucose/arabinose dehydrogenase
MIRTRVAGILSVALLLIAGCKTQPSMLTPENQVAIDRSIVEYPSNTELVPVIRGLTAPTAMAFDDEGNLLIAESGIGGKTSPRIIGFRPDGAVFDIFPRKSKLPFALGGDKVLHEPIGGMVVHQGTIFVSHRDENGMGVITAFGYDGTHRTVVADLPARGDHSVTDLAINPQSGRLFFGVGSATNSGVVGIDNYESGWLRDYPDFCDQPWNRLPLELLGYRFTTPNPRAGIGQEDIKVTGPMQPMGTSNQDRIKGSEKPTSAIYSVAPSGGDLRVEAHGIRVPRGLRYNEFYRLFATNNGMELRGTRPIKDDPDTLVRVVSGTWYGFPDFTADFNPVTLDKYQPPSNLVLPSGYPKVRFTINHEESSLLAPDRNSLLQGTFQPLSGAAKFDFVPTNGAFKAYRGNAVIALSGDRAPFATSGQALTGPIGYKVVLVDVDSKVTKDFIYNTRGVPASMLPGKVEAIERPIDVKFGPDDAIYILDFGQMEMRKGRERVTQGSGRVFKLVATKPATTNPDAAPATP